MFLNKNFTNLAFGFLLIFKSSHAVDQSKMNDFKNKVYNEKTHAGPMGMGLTKSYQVNDQIICIYNTIKGQVKISLKNLNKCPLKIPVTNN